MPSELLTRHMASAILLLMLGGITTQMIAIATGRDYLFGLVPKLNPAGTRNLPTWFAFACFAACAVWASVAAATAKARQARSAHGWWWLAGLLCLLSADRIVSLRQLWNHLASVLFGDAATASLILTIDSGLLVAIYAISIRYLPHGHRWRFGSAAAVFVLGAVACSYAAADSRGADTRAANLLITSFGRVLELGGIMLMIGAVVRYLRSEVGQLLITVDGNLNYLLDAHGGRDSLELRVSVGRLRCVLIMFTCGILVASFAVATARELAGWDVEFAYRLLYVDFEGNLPTWWSSLLLLASGGVLALISAARHHDGDARWRYWGMMAVLVVALSADEAASFHELSVMPLRALLGGNPWLRYPLIIPGAMAVIAVVTVFRRFFSDLPSDTRRAFTTGGGLFIVGALLLETVGGWFDPLVHGPNLTYIGLATLEEGCEMLGVVVLLVGLLRHVEMAIGTLQFPTDH